MPEEYVVTWPYLRPTIYTQEAERGAWEPMKVHLYDVRDPWTEPLYAPVFAERVTLSHRPQRGVLVVHPVSGEELALIVRVPYRNDARLRFRATWCDDGYVSGGPPNSHVEDLVESRRWVGMRPGGVVIRPTTTKEKAIRVALMYCRVRPPVVIETQPEGEDADAMAGLG